MAYTLSMAQRLWPDEELDGLIRRLNEAAGQLEEVDETPTVTATPPAAAVRAERWTLPPIEAEAELRLEELLARARETWASDLLLVAGTPPVVRVDGALRALGERCLSPGETSLLCAALVPAERREPLAAQGAVDFSMNRAGAGRCRVHVHRERDRWSAAVRLFPDEPPDLRRLGLPATLAGLVHRTHGLVLVTGPTGSGKSTTLAALVREILARRRVHLITIEDPVEFEHEPNGSVVEHIEIGRDAVSFPAALRSILRHDPDVLLIGEMRDAESIAIAITAAETGHLVLATLHTGDAPQTIHRILDSYPANQIATVRAQLAASLVGVVSQQLLARRDGRGRVPAVEVLVGTPAVRHLIRQGKLEQMRSQFALERQSGMLDLDDSLIGLARDGLVDPDEARLRAHAPEEFDRRLRVLRDGGRTGRGGARPVSRPSEDGAAG